MNQTERDIVDALVAQRDHALADLAEARTEYKILMKAFGERAGQGWTPKASDQLSAAHQWYNRRKDS